MAKILSTIILAAAVSCASAQIITLGGLCSGIAGPIYGTCISGTKCCAVGPDRSLCAAVSSCPSQFVPVNGLCSGFAGPSPYPCWPGTTCCNVSPDNSVCKYSC